MTRQGIGVAVVSLATPSRCSALRDLLADLGYLPVVLQGEVPRPADLARLEIPLIFLLGSDGLSDRARSSLLSTPSRLPAVVIVDAGDPLWNDQRLQGDRLTHVADIITWPCRKEELGWRLRRAGLTQPPPSGLPNALSQIQDLASLNMVGRSRAFSRVQGLIRKVAQYDAPVLVQGDTGTGKELAARAIHYLGPRRDHPFTPVNCGAVPDALLENELFGHERGAYTDAREKRPGLLAQASRGTLFLDEVDTLSPKGQVVLLRVVEDCNYRPLGSASLRSADVRIIASTNADLVGLVKRGEFRQDLLFRLNVLTINLPRLRERSEDISTLAEHFLTQCSGRYRRPRKNLHPTTLAWMRSWAWPGNVRQLENFIHRSFLLSEGSSIQIPQPPAGDEDPQLSVASGSENLTFNEAKARVIAAFEKEYLRGLMAETHGNVSAAARRAGKERHAFRRLLQKHGVHPRAGPEPQV